MVSYVFFIGCKSRTNNGKVSILATVFALKTWRFEIFGIGKLGNFLRFGQFPNFPIRNSKICTPNLLNVVPNSEVHVWCDDIRQ